MPIKYYAVARGRKTGVYNSWAECQAQVDGFSGSMHKHFDSHYAAQQFVDSAASLDSAETPIVPVTVNGRKRPSKREDQQLQLRRRPIRAPPAADQFAQLCFGGIFVRVPRELSMYPSQKLMIARMITAFKGNAQGKGQNAMIESPTGSGKTLALLIAACAFLTKYKQDRAEQKRFCPKHGSEGGVLDPKKSNGVEGEAKPAEQNEANKRKIPNSNKIEKTPTSKVRSENNSPAADQFSGIQQHLGPGDGSFSSPLIIMDDDEDASRMSTASFRSSKMESVNGDRLNDDKTLKEWEEEQAILHNDAEHLDGDEGAAEELEDDRKGPKCTCKPRMRIYYGTRTHKQIQQVVQEFKRLPYAYKETMDSYTAKLRHTILGSREQTCINQSVRNPWDSEAQKKTLTSRCKDLVADKEGCLYRMKLRDFEGAPQKLRYELEKATDQVWDLEDLVTALNTQKEPCCPYFASTRLLTQDADIVFCPFNYLIDPIIRNSSDVHLKDAIVILDEAHNVEDNCRDAASFEFQETELLQSINHIEEKYRFLKDKAQCVIEDNPTEKGDGNKMLCLDIDGRKSFGQIEQVEDVEAEDKLQANTSTEITEFSRALQITLDFMRDMHKFFCVMVHQAEAKMGKHEQQADQFTHTFGWENLHEKLHQFDGLTCKPTHIRLKVAVGMFFVTKSAPTNADTSSDGSRGSQPLRDTFLDQFRPSAASLVCVEKFICFWNFFNSESNHKFYRCNIKMTRQGTMGYNKPAFNYGFSPLTSRNHKRPPQHLGFGDEDADLWQNTSFGSSHQSQQQHLVNKFEFSRPGFDVTLNIWCMFPRVAMMDAFNDVHSVVLASGTLCPAETLKTELGIDFAVQMEGDQVISRERIFASVVPESPNGHKLVATYKNIMQKDFIRELANLVSHTCFTVPKGVLCFLSSYGVLDQLHDGLERSANWPELTRKKKVLKEPRRTTDLKEVMEEFDQAILNTGIGVDGALMLAVFRGKISEGIDFADDKARCVICVGIPFPSVKDELVLQKKRFNDDNCRQLHILTGDEWYNIQAYRALNQALGRCLRHRMDWGALMLVDERFVHRAKGPDAKKISKWVRQQLSFCKNFDQFKRGLTEFVDRYRGESNENHQLMLREKGNELDQQQNFEPSPNASSQHPVAFH